MSLPIPRADRATSRQLAAANQRDRLLFAVMSAVAHTGYARTTVADVIARAGVSRRTFYEHFDNVEDCFVAAYRLGSDRLHRIVVDATSAAPSDASWREILHITVEAYLAAFAEQPEFAFAAMIDVLAAGPTARDLYLENVARFDQTVRAFLHHLSDLDDAPTVSDSAVSLALGGLARFVTVELLAGRASDLPAHAPELGEALARFVRPRPESRGHGVGSSPPPRGS